VAVLEVEPEGHVVRLLNLNRAQGALPDGEQGVGKGVRHWRSVVVVSGFAPVLKS
jgi:hypothetical protein